MLTEDEPCTSWCAARARLAALEADHAEALRLVADLQNRLGEAQAKIRRQAGVITDYQAREGRRAVHPGGKPRRV